ATFRIHTVPPDVIGTVGIDGTPVSLTTTTPGQNMSLSFNGVAGQRISTLLQYGRSFDIACNGWTVLQPNGTTQMFSSQACNMSTFSDVLILPVAGTYTMLFNPGCIMTGTATFTIYNEPPDASATITPGGGTITLTTTTPGQNIGLIFSGVAGQRVSLFMV